MATSTTSNTRKRQVKNGTRASAVSRQRKKEILGLILIAFAILVSLALVTYHPEDDPLARRLTLEMALRPGSNVASNRLGLIGAVLARWLVPGFLGYNTLFFSLIILGWGYTIFRNRKPVHLPLLTVLGTVATFALASVLGLLHVTFGQETYLWSGAWGVGIASWTQQVFGTTGALILFFLTFLIVALLLIDRDIQKSIDRVEDAARYVRDAVRSWWSDYRERRAANRLEKADRQPERFEKITHPQRKPEPSEDPFARRSAGPAHTTASHPANDRRLNLPPRPAPGTVERPAAAEPTINDLFAQRPIPASLLRPTPLTEEPLPDLELKIRERVEEEKVNFTGRKEVENVREALPYEFPSLDLLDEPDDDSLQIDYAELEENKRVLLDKLATYNIEITDINAIVGPTVTLYELTPAPGVKISRITALEDDLAMAMAARGIRMIAPIPGKTAIGVEIPNRHRELVRIRDVIGTAKFRDARMELPVTIGKTIEGEVFLEDLTRMPHLLIAGATGSGKSVGLNALITGLIYACHPSNLKFVMIDPKKIELQQYARMIDHYIAMPPDADEPIITDFVQALGVLKCCEKEMERRYDLLSRATVRGIKDYNQKFKQGRLSPDEGHGHLPYIVVVVDELADLMMTAGKDIEGPIARLAQMARAVGIHLVLATQRPSVDVITGLIKANFPSRIAYQVASKVDSRTILDQNGAEGLVGNGDLLYMMGSRVIRLQGPFVSVDEVDRITSFIADQKGAGPYILPSLEESSFESIREGDASGEEDDLFEEAARIIVRSQQGSVSLLQRKLSVGYARAARIVDQLEEAGIVGPFEGSKARQVLIENEMQLDELLKARQDES